MADMPDVYKPKTTRIDVGDKHDVMLWALALGVAPQTVLTAVTIAGDDALAVQAYLVCRRNALPACDRRRGIQFISQAQNDRAESHAGRSPGWTQGN